MDLFSICRNYNIGGDIINVLVNSEQAKKELDDFKFMNKRVFRTIQHTRPVKSYSQYLNSFFPGEEHKQIQFDEEYSLSYVTPFSMADKITTWILTECNCNNAIDLTAGLGGNVLSFARNENIKSVIGVELNEKRFQSLKHNVNLYPEKKKIQLFNSNLIDFLQTHQFDNSSFVYMDPPWGGISYQDEPIDELFFYKDDKSYATNEIVSQLLKRVNCVVLKVPYNYSEVSLKGLKYRTRIDKKVKHVLIPSQTVKMLPKMIPPNPITPDIAYNFQPDIQLPTFINKVFKNVDFIVLNPQKVTIPVVQEEEEKHKLIRYHFIQKVVERTKNMKEAIEYSYFHLNNMIYKTRYGEKIENRLNILRSFL